LDNKSIVKTLLFYVDLMTLHEENEFKIKGYSNAIFNLERYNKSIDKTSLEDLEQLSGVGKSCAKAIDEINTSGQLQALESLKHQTPAGVIDMLSIKGVGAKKIKLIWKQLDITDTAALLECIEKGELSKVKGFGEKTAQNIKETLLYLEANKYKLHYSEAEAFANQLVSDMRKQFPQELIEVTGEIRRKMDIINEVKLVIGTDDKSPIFSFLASQDSLTHQLDKSGPFNWRGIINKGEIPISVRCCSQESFYNTLILTTGNVWHLSETVMDDMNLHKILQHNQLRNESQAYDLLKVPFIAPELREGQFEWQTAKENKLPKLVEMNDLKGILHNHSTWSDGIHSLKQMAEKCRDLGYEYLGISDHSKSAFFYANGLFEDRIEKQHAEIDQLNEEMAPFKIFKGIESDILTDGKLDYDDAVLASFDFIVSSIHSGLGMDIKRATERLVTAIANPYTTMLGHPTGRLLLKRKGYPIDHKTVIDACAKYGVIIEINANPWRLDLDWRWVHYAIAQGVKLSINPDAHKMEGYDDMYYGLCVGRKGGLTKEMTFNALSLQEVSDHFQKRKELATATLT
jgi:DNA polymerase (family 10)